MIRRPPRSTRVRSSAASDVYKRQVQGDGSRATSMLVVVLLGLSLALRRVRPLGTALVVLFTWPVVFTFTPLLVLFWRQFVPIMIAVFSVARYGRGREPWYGALAGAATLLFMDLRVEVLQTPARSSSTGACSLSRGGSGGGFVPWSGGPRSRCSAPSMSRWRRPRTQWPRSSTSGPASRASCTTWSRTRSA